MTSTQKQTLIAPSTAAFLSVLYTLIYVLPFYISQATRPGPFLPRDAPSVIRARIRAVTLSCVVCTLLTAYVILHYGGDMSLLQAAHLLGWWPISLLELLKSLLLVIILFAGPLFEAGVVDGGWKDWLAGDIVSNVLGTWVGFRNYIVGPLSEELVFRSLLLALHLLSVSPSRASTSSESPALPLTLPRGTVLSITLLTPLYFGLAHIHHFYEFVLSHPYTPLLPALLRSLFQLTYTAVFGAFATFLFLRTASLPAVFVTHAFCNWMGLPRVWGRVGVVEEEGLHVTEVDIPIGPPDIHSDEDEILEGKADGEPRNFSGREFLSQQHYQRRRFSLGWTAAYYVLLVGGAVGFYKNLWYLTESDRALVRF